jgi:hypothetical protein
LGWLFTQYDKEPADEIMRAWAMWGEEARARAGIKVDEFGVEYTED